MSFDLRFPQRGDTSSKKMNRPRLALTLAPFLTLAISSCAGEDSAGIDLPATPATAVAVSRATPLDAYVAAPDSAYSWSVHSSITGDGVSAHVLDLTSQSWLETTEVENSVWRHWLTVVVPETVESDLAFLYINGGDNDDPAPTEIDPRWSAMAAATGTVVAELRMVPNQPLRFAGDERDGRWEDALIAWGWDKFLRGGRAEWLARLPMTKSAVRAMDAVTDWGASAEGGALDVSRFVVAGGSKRGWTTWTTAAVDERVVAIVPIVIDLLNVVPSFDHHFRAYGFWAPAVRDYEEAGIMDWMGRAEFAGLLELTEPFHFRDRLTLPKLLVNASGDQFFLPDSSQFYWDDLVGEKHLRYVPNAGHSLSGSDAFETVLAFYGSVVAGAERPRYDWRELGENGLEVTVDAASPPAHVRLWQATNSEARDFRIGVLGPAYTSVDLEATDEGVYTARVETPPEGWTAFFVELEYPAPDAGAPLKLTTAVRVVPDALPFPSPLPADAVPSSRASF